MVVDPDRVSLNTGILVPADTVDGQPVHVDISVLKRTSLLRWLRSRGGNNPWAENVVGVLLGYGNLHED